MCTHMCRFCKIFWNIFGLLLKYFRNVSTYVVVESMILYYYCFETKNHSPSYSFFYEIQSNFLIYKLITTNSFQIITTYSVFRFVIPVNLYSGYCGIASHLKKKCLFASVFYRFRYLLLTVQWS